MPPPTETLLGLSTKHSWPEWYPVPAVVTVVHFEVSSAVPSNSSSNVQTHGAPVGLSTTSPPQLPSLGGGGGGVVVVGGGVGVVDVGVGVGHFDVGVGVGVGVVDVGVGVGVVDVGVGVGF